MADRLTQLQDIVNQVITKYTLTLGMHFYVSCPILNFTKCQVPYQTFLLNVWLNLRNLFVILVDENAYFIKKKRVNMHQFYKKMTKLIFYLNYKYHTNISTRTFYLV